jgi:flagellin
LARLPIWSEPPRGRIIDADVAADSAKLLSGKILQQATAAVLAQANQQPALAPIPFNES